MLDQADAILAANCARDERAISRISESLIMRLGELTLAASSSAHPPQCPLASRPSDKVALRFSKYADRDVRSSGWVSKSSDKRLRDSKCFHGRGLGDLARM